MAASKNRKLAVLDGAGGWRLRIYRRKPRGKMSPRLLIKCGDCEAHVTIYYSPDGLEIDGVNASLEEWRAVLLPLLDGRDIQ